jgi:hypothetical protein
MSKVFKARKMRSQKGMALFIVLGTILVVVILANVMLTIMLSHFRLTHHQLSRIRAYYSAIAGMNMAFDNLRTGLWLPGNSYILNDPDIPYPVTITIGPVAGPAETFPNVAPINITTNYTYTSP